MSALFRPLVAEHHHLIGISWKEGSGFISRRDLSGGGEGGSVSCWVYPASHPWEQLQLPPVTLINRRLMEPAPV